MRRLILQQSEKLSSCIKESAEMRNHDFAMASTYTAMSFSLVRSRKVTSVRWIQSRHFAMSDLRVKGVADRVTLKKNSFIHLFYFFLVVLGLHCFTDFSLVTEVNGFNSQGRFPFL